MFKLTYNVSHLKYTLKIKGAIWKCSISKENVKIFKDIKTIDYLVQLLSDPTEEVSISYNKYKNTS